MTHAPHDKGTQATNFVTSYTTDYRAWIVQHPSIARLDVDVLVLTEHEPHPTQVKHRAQPNPSECHAHE